MSIEKLASIVNIVPGFLQPDRQIFRIETLLDEFGIAAIWWIDISDVGVVCSFTSQESNSGWTAHCSRAIVFIIVGSFLQQVFSHQWHVIKRLEVNILVVGQDEDYIRWFSRL